MSAPPASTLLPPALAPPSIADIRERALKCFGKRPCLWQIRVTQALLKGDRDIICIAGTGQGKTLGFWMPLLFRPKGILIVVVPLNLLGEQHAQTLTQAGISAISISAENASHENFQAIRDGQYRAVAINPEQLMKSEGEFENLLKDRDFLARLLGFVFDEVHCVSAWGDFRPEYKDVKRLRHLLPSHIPFLVTSATLPTRVLADVRETLQFHTEKELVIRRPTDRPNIHISVRKIRNPLGSFADLAFLIPDGWKPGDPLPSKFLIFFDNINEAIAAADYLRNRLPREYQHHITWFCSDMSTEFKVNEVKNIAVGITWGSCTTDSFGMGFDLPDIVLVMQWRVTCTLSTLWQRFGRAARAFGLTAHAILFAEKEYFDSERREKEQRRIKREEAKARKKLGNQATKRKRPIEKDTPVKRTALGLSTSVPVSQRIQTSSEDQGVVSLEMQSADAESSLLSIPAATHGIHAPPTSMDFDLGTADNSENCNGNDSDVPTDSSDGENDDGREGRIEDRRRLYEETPKQLKGGKRTRDDLEPAMDDFINADERRLRCRRVPVRIYFNDAEASSSDHLECDPSLPTGCTRCCMGVSTVCCDLHNPPAFRQFDTPLIKPARDSNRSALAKFEMTQADRDLLNALDDWRDEKTIAVFGRAALYNMGPSLIMSDATMHRIVDCAHFSKIKTVEELERETHWNRSSNYFSDIILLVREHCPAPPVPLQQSNVISSNGSTPIAAPAAPAARKAPKCSRCGLTGHNSRNKVCEKHPSREAASTGLKENYTSRSQ